MKRLVAYIYGYRNGIKGKNAGFGKIDTKGDDIKLSIAIRGNVTEENMQAYFYVREGDETYILRLGSMQGNGLEYELKREVNILELSKGKYTSNDIDGLIIKVMNEVKYVSFWKEEYSIGETKELLDNEPAEDEVAEDNKDTVDSSIEIDVKKQIDSAIEKRIDKDIEKQEGLTIEERKEIEVEEEDTVYLVDTDCTPVDDEYVAKQIELKTTSIAQYIKNRKLKEIWIGSEKHNMCEIMPNDIYEFPRECWGIGKNAYACHGFIKYGKLYVIDGDGLYLAVPGYSSGNERIMAERYGFNVFIEQDVECLKPSSCIKWRRGFWCKKIMNN